MNRRIRHFDRALRAEESLYALAVAVTIAFSLLIFTAQPISAAADEPPNLDPVPYAPQGRPYTVYKTPIPAPLTEIRDADGVPLSLERYRGKVVLLNFWATWCIPCIKEMPDLDRLQQALGPKGLAVVPLSLNRLPEAAKEFYKITRLKALPLLFDHKGAARDAFKVRGLPASYIIGRDGTLHGYLEGPAPWDSDKAKALLTWYLDQKQ